MYSLSGRVKKEVTNDLACPCVHEMPVGPQNQLKSDGVGKGGTAERLNRFGTITLETAFEN